MKIVCRTVSAAAMAVALLVPLTGVSSAETSTTAAAATCASTVRAIAPEEYGGTSTYRDVKGQALVTDPSRCQGREIWVGGQYYSSRGWQTFGYAKAIIDRSEQLYQSRPLGLKCGTQIRSVYTLGTVTVTGSTYRVC